MKNTKSRLIRNMMTGLMIIMGLFIVGQTSQASQLNFSVKPVLPEFQLDKEKTYFDLKLPNKNDTEVEVVLSNQTDKDVTVETSLNRATTNINGIVEYGKPTEKDDSSLVIDIEKIVTIAEPSVVVKAKSDRKINIKIAQPKEKIEGVLAAGLTFKEKQADEDEGKSEGLAIKNEYAYLVALLIHGDKKQEDIKSELVLNEVEATQSNVRNMIAANLQNTQGKYLNKLAIEGKVTKKDDKETLYELKKTDLQMAPNSNFNYLIPLDGKRMVPGKYTVHLTAKSESGDWKFDKDFTITAEEAKEYNEKDVNIEKPDYTWFYVAGGVALLVLIQIMIIIIIKKKKATPKGKSKLAKKTDKQVKSKKASGKSSNSRKKSTKQTYSADERKSKKTNSSSKKSNKTRR